MKFAIDCRRIQPGMTGLGSYTLGLVTALAHLIPRRGHELILFATPDSGALLSDITERVTMVNVKWPVENHLQGEYWKHVRLPRILNSHSIDLFHDPAYQLPFIRSKAAYVVTIHDLAPFRHPETNTLKYNLYWRWMTRTAINRAERVIAVSEFTKSETEEMFPSVRGRVDVISEAAAPCFTHKPPEMDILRHHGIDRPYFLTAAKYEPRKNLARCIESFIAGPATINSDIQLVVAGAIGWKTADIDSIMKSSDFRDRIIFTGYLERPHLIEIMRGAMAIVVPSVYEGFGLPVLEAMACGAPVICSRIASLPEVGGDAAVYFDPFQAGSIKKAMIRVLSDGSLRQEMLVKGLARAAGYSWTTAAEKTFETYCRVLKTTNNE